MGIWRRKDHIWHHNWIRTPYYRRSGRRDWQGPTAIATLVAITLIVIFVSLADGEAVGNTIARVYMIIVYPIVTILFFARFWPKAFDYLPESYSDHIPAKGGLALLIAGIFLLGGLAIIFHLFPTK